MANEMMLQEELSLMNTLLDARKALSKEDQKILSELKQISRTAVNVKVNSKALGELQMELSAVNYELNALSQPKELKTMTSGLELVKKYTGEASRNINQFEKSLTKTGKTTGDLSSSVKILKEYDFGTGEKSGIAGSKSNAGSMKEAKGYFIGLGADLAMTTLESLGADSGTTSILAETINGAIAGVVVGGLPGALVGATAGLLVSAIKVGVQQQEEAKQMYAGVVQSMFRDVKDYGSDLLLEPILNYAQRQYDDAEDEAARLNTFLGKYEEVETLKTGLMDFAAEKYMEVREEGLGREKAHYEENAEKYKTVYGAMAVSQAELENEKADAFIESQLKFFDENKGGIIMASLLMSDEPSNPLNPFSIPLGANAFGSGGNEFERNLTTQLGLQFTGGLEVAESGAALAVGQSDAHQMALEVNKEVIEGQKGLVLEYKGVIEDMKGLQKELSQFEVKRNITRTTDITSGKYMNGIDFSNNQNLVGGKAYGLQYVPYNNFPALLHEGERVLTASESRAYRDPMMPMVTGNTFIVRQEQDIDKIAETLAAKLKTAAMISA